LFRTTATARTFGTYNTVSRGKAPSTALNAQKSFVPIRSDSDASRS
jgi:hypothetical protein